MITDAEIEAVVASYMVGWKIGVAAAASGMKLEQFGSGDVHDGCRAFYDVAEAKRAEWVKARGGRTER
jgi:hypothetical protein